jgi:hypothetical protein
MFFSNLKQKLNRNRQKEIPLEFLSRLWIEKEMPKQSSLQNPMSAHWTHADINQFYARYIVPNSAALGHAAPVTEHLLTLLDDKGDCPSFSEDLNDEKIFTKISLREHSLTVTRMAVDIIKKVHRDFELILGKILIICLGHRLGILSSATNIGGVSARSLLMLHPLIQDLDFKNNIITAIRTFEDNHPKTDETRILKAATLSARKHLKERSEVLSQMDQQGVLDISKIRAAIFSPERIE